MYEVITDLVDDLVASLPDDARERFDQFVEAVAQSPLGGYLVTPDDPGEHPSLLWPIQTAHGYGQVLYTVYYRPEEALFDPARAQESDRVVVDDVVWIE